VATPNHEKPNVRKSKITFGRRKSKNSIALRGLRPARQWRFDRLRRIVADPSHAGGALRYPEAACVRRASSAIVRIRRAAVLGKHLIRRPHGRLNEMVVNFRSQRKQLKLFTTRRSPLFDVRHYDNVHEISGRKN
jgi:hypothetical protein